LLAEMLDNNGIEVIFVTPADRVASWAENTLEQHKIQAGLIRRGIRIICHHNVSRIEDGKFILKCTYSGREQIIEGQSFLPVTARISDDRLYHEVMERQDDFRQCGIKSVTRIGDCHAPSTIAAAVYHGHLQARQVDTPGDLWTDFRRENNWQ